MDGTRDLQLLLAAFRYGAVDPAAVSAAGAAWNPATDGPFVPFLVARGVIPADLPGRLESDATATVAFPPAADAADTPTHLPTPDAALPPTVRVRDPDLAPRPAPADRPPMPRYQMARFHRSGGLGEVWVARDTLIGRDVALKRIRADRPDTPANRRRFVREARVTGQLEHPCVVPLYDLTPDDPTGPSYVMRFVDGHTLTEAAAGYHAARKEGRADRLHLAKLLDAFVAVCRAVAFAHSRGVIHRDLKGPNVILGEFGEVFLLDWGLAKRTGDPDPAAEPDSGRVDPADTPPGSQVGTPAYMSPELAAGAPANRQTDVYALGCILYTVLTGQPPVDGVTPQEVMQKVRAAAPPPPRAVVPATPPALEAVCLKAMARTAADRYASAEAVAEDVRRWLADEPVTAYPEPWLVRAGRWAKRHRAAVLAAAVALATATVALAVSTALVWREERKTAAALGVARQEWERAEQERDRAETNLRLAHAISRQVIEGWVEGKLPAVAGTEKVRRDLADFVLQRYVETQSQHPDDPATARRLAQLHRYAANLHRLLGGYPTAERSYREAVRIWRDQMAAAPPSDTTPRDHLGQALWDYAELLKATGRLADAGAAADEAVELTTGLADAHPRTAWYRRAAALASQGRAELALDRGRFEPATADADRAVALLKGLMDGPAADRVPLDPVLYGSMLTTAAVIDRQRGWVGAAAAAHRQAVQVLLDRKAAGGPDQPDVVSALGWAILEQSRTWAGIPGRQDDAERNLGKLGALDLADWLTRRYPGIVVYRELRVAALLTRGDIRADLGRPGPAAADFEAAAAEADRLTAEVPGAPAFRRYAGLARAGLARVTPDRTQAAALLDRAEADLRQARDAAPDDARTAAALAAVTAARGR